MDRNKVFLTVTLIIVLIICAISFFAVKKSSKEFQEILKQNNAEPLYNKAELLLKTEGKDKAAAAVLSAIINGYPESEYAEKAIKKLINIYIKQHDYEKAEYYYTYLLENFPETNGTDKMRDDISDINIKILVSPKIGEDSIEYVVQSGDTLFAIARRFNTTVALLKKINKIQNDIIRTGQNLKVVVSKFSVLVDKSDNVLSLREDGKLFKTYKVSTGKDNSTPIGTFKIEEKMIKPIWYKVGAVVSPDSEEYELGERWLGLSVEGYGIHGTSDENTIGSQITQGCVRMYNNDIVELFDIIPSGTEVKIVD